MLLKKAITREPGRSYNQCISDHPLKGRIEIEEALKQHQAYCETLESLGLEVISLPREDKLPDSCFVEDTAVISKGKAFITRMALKSRRGEEKAIFESLNEYFPIEKALDPATIEGGDVIHFNDQLIIGLTQRTNLEGIKQLKDWLQVHVNVLEAQKIMHLKSHITYLGKNTMILINEYSNHPIFLNNTKIIVPKDEEYAANTLSINDVILMSSNHQKSINLVRDAGFEVISLNISEFEKCCGALTCLSLIF